MVVIGSRGATISTKGVLEMSATGVIRLICSPSGAVITTGTTLSVMVPPNKNV